MFKQFLHDLQYHNNCFLIIFEDTFKSLSGVHINSLNYLIAYIVKTC